MQYYCDYNYEIDVKRYFIPIDELNSKGNPKCIPVVIRKMILTAIDYKGAATSNLFPLKIKIVRFVRGGEVRYSVSQLIDHQKTWWENKIAEEPTKFKKVETLTEDGCLRYLVHRLGNEAVCAFNKLLTEEPEC